MYFKASDRPIKNTSYVKAKTKNKKTARCTLCQKEMDLSTMQSAALDSYIFSKKHNEDG